MDLETFVWLIMVVGYFVYNFFQASGSENAVPEPAPESGKGKGKGKKAKTIEEILGDYLEGQGKKSEEEQQLEEWEMEEELEPASKAEPKSTKPRAAPKKSRALSTTGSESDNSRPSARKLRTKSSEDSKKTDDVKDKNYRPLTYDPFKDKKKRDNSLADKLAAIEAEKEAKRAERRAKRALRKDFKFDARDAIIYQVIFEKKY